MQIAGISDRNNRFSCVFSITINICLRTCPCFRMWMLLQLYTTRCRVQLFLVLVVVECEYNILYLFMFKFLSLLIYSCQVSKHIFLVVPCSSFYFFLYKFWCYVTVVYIDLFWHSLTSRTFSKNPFGRRKDSAGGVAGILNGASANWELPEGDVFWTLACHHGFHATPSYLSSACFC